MKIYEKTLPSTDGRHTLHGVVYEPDGDILGIVQVVHGKSEHIDRYDRFMRALCDAGYLAFGHNHIGHKSSSGDDELGFFGYDGGFRHMVNDVNAFGDAVAEQYPGKKRFLFGHSMGSFVVRLAALQSGDKLSGLIVCGTGGPQKGARAGLILCNIVTLFHGGRYVSPFLEKLVFSKYTSRTGDDNPDSWLSTDKDEVNKFSQDEYCGFMFTACGMHDLIKLNYVSNKPIWSYAISPQLPIFLIAGTDDPVGDYGKGVQKVYDRLAAAGRNVKIKLYNGARHEILNDFCRDEVTDDILEFIGENI